MDQAFTGRRGQHVRVECNDQNRARDYAGMIENRQVQAELAGFVLTVRVKIKPVRQGITLGTKQQDRKNQRCSEPENHIEEMLTDSRCEGHECNNTLPK
jgi:DNA primase catalytic subunit